MNIALDYDNTFTRDPTFWEEFIIRTSNHGHCVWIVTLRSRIHDPIILDQYVETSLVSIVYCDGMPKFSVCRECGITIDVWIDDSPESVHCGSPLNAEQLEEWRRKYSAEVTYA